MISVYTAPPSILGGIEAIFPLLTTSTQEHLYKHRLRGYHRTAGYGTHKPAYRLTSYIVAIPESFLIRALMLLSVEHKLIFLAHRFALVPPSKQAAV